ncbi:MAG: DUF554 domain-containing protein [Solobacterium sp.]|nr:DUF554 domain-containing protein [Solobacterium sp.]
MGTLINCAAIIAGGILGILFGSKIPEHVRETVLKANGAAVIILGIAGALSKMLVITDGGIETVGTLNMILSLCIGSLIGEWLDIEAALERFGEYLKRKTGSESDSRFTEGFMTASLTVCIGAMAIVGAIEDGIYGIPSILISKALLDFVIILVMASSLGKGVVFSFIPVGILQGGVTILAFFLQGIFTEAGLNALSLCGSVIIALVGVNLLFGKTVKTANLLPGLIIAVILAGLGV